MNDHYSLSGIIDGVVDSWLALWLTLGCGFGLYAIGFGFWYIRRYIERSEGEKRREIERRLADPREWDTETHPKRSHQPHITENGDDGG